MKVKNTAKKATPKATINKDALEDLNRQREYVAALKEKKFSYNLILADAFVRGMRDLGYKNTATAIDELLDNSIQAGASKVCVDFGFEGSVSPNEPSQIVVCDNGHGMEPEMLRASVVWGGTHRENDREGLGRYGYGMKSACVSFGRRFTVYSKTAEGDWYEVVVDLEDIASGRYNNSHGDVVAPVPKKTKLPDWLHLKVKKNCGEPTSGTVVVVDKIDRDRLTYKYVSKLKEFLLIHFGVTYRNFLTKVSIQVEGTQTGAIDPLFTTPGFRFYDENEDRAEAFEPLLIDVKDKNTKEVIGTITVRFSYMNYSFFKIQEERLKPNGGLNVRNEIRKDNNGFIVLRAGRQIDVITKNPDWVTFQPYERHIGIEINFPPVLDEEFAITTSKQQVVISQRIWDILEQNGVREAISSLRSRYRKEAEEKKKLAQESNQLSSQGDPRRVSEVAVQEAQKFVAPVETPTTDESKKSKSRLEQEVKRRSTISGVPPEEVRKQLILEAQGRPYKVDFVEHPGAPFYRVEQVGGQKVLYINKSHRFYTDLYIGPESTPRLRNGLEVLLLVLGICELGCKPEIQLFYETERSRWSQQLNLSLARLAEWTEPNETDDEVEELAGTQKSTSVESK